MEFKQKKFTKLHYKRSTYTLGVVAELTIKENGRAVNYLSWKTNNDFKVVLGLLKKYGWYADDKKFVEEEIKFLEECKEKDGDK